MVFEPGHPKMGGKKVGSKNKKKITKAEQVMHDYGFNPIAEMIKLSLDPKTPKSIKMKIDIELSKLINPPAKEAPVKEEETTEIIGEEANLDNDSLLDVVQ